MTKKQLEREVDRLNERLSESRSEVYSLRGELRDKIIKDAFTGRALANPVSRTEVIMPETTPTMKLTIYVYPE